MGKGGAIVALKDFEKDIPKARLKATTELWWLKPQDKQPKWKDHIPVQTLKYTGQYGGVRRDEFEWLNVKRVNIDIKDTDNWLTAEYSYTRLRPNGSPPGKERPGASPRAAAPPPLASPRRRTAGPGGGGGAGPISPRPPVRFLPHRVSPRVPVLGPPPGGAIPGTRRPQTVGQHLETLMLESVMSGRAAIAEDVRNGRALTCRACLHPTKTPPPAVRREAMSPVRPRLPSINLQSPFTPRQPVAENSESVRAFYTLHLVP